MTISKTKIVRVLASLCFILFTSLATAHDNVVVIPMADDDIKPLANIVTVAKQGGDFTSPVAAIASITGASSTNPYVLVIAPGVYELGNQQLVMKEYVDIAGSGQNATVLRGTVNSGTANNAAALVVGTNNASISNLTIENVNNPSGFAIGLFNNDASPTLSDIAITLSGGAYQYGVYNDDSSSPTISDTTIIVSGGSNVQTGVYNDNSSSSIFRSTITVSSGSNSQYGVFSRNNSTATISDTRIVVSIGSGFLIGNYNQSGSSSNIVDGTIIVSGSGSSQYGVFNFTATDSSKIQNSSISASTNSVRASTGSGSNESYISNSILSSPVSGNPTCFFTFLLNGTALNSSCS